MFNKIVEKIKEYFNKNEGDDLLLLSPKILNNDVINHYVNELEKTIENEDATNVALAGNYGTGKSSIIKTFRERKRNKRKYIVITIGSFLTTVKEKQKVNQNISQTGEQKEETSNDKKVDPDELEVVDKIEQSILKQLIHLNTSDEMPASNIRRINDNKFKLFRYFYLITIPLIYFICNKFNYYISYLTSLYWNITTESFIHIAFILYLVFLLITIYRLLEKLINKIGLIEIKSNNYNIKFNGESDLTFNKKLYELIYFFKVNKPKAIFFEDIDRFSEDVVIKVIEELKELNYIINKSLSHKVTFIYSFRDNIFSDMKERSKFYDYISSVMIISTGYNSLVQLYSILDQKKINKQEISNKLIGIVSKHITDIRTLICIVNDYCTFKKILKINKNDKIFAMCTYKNYYFDDYTNILNSNNLIEKHFNSIEAKRQSLLNEKNKKIIDIQEKIEEKKVYENSGIIALKKEFLYDNTRDGRFPTKINIDNKGYLIADFYDDSFDLSKLNYATLSNPYYSSYEIKKDSVNKLLEKVKLINSDELEKQQLALQKENEQILKLSDIEIYNKYFELNNPQLIDELIMNEYIEKDYIDFITAPAITNELNSLDNKFMFDVQHEIYSFETNIGNPKEMKFYLFSYFDKPHILNITLVSYLIEDSNKINSVSKKYIDKIIEQFKTIDEHKLTFLFLYCNRNKNYYYKFLEFLLEKDINIFNIFIDSNITNKKFFSSFIVESILRLENSISSINDKAEFIKMLNQFFETNSFELNNILLSNDIVRKNLIDINYRFNDLYRYDEYNLRFIYENNLYTFLYKNLVTMTNNKIVDSDLKSIFRLPEYQKLSEYIKSSFNAFGLECYQKIPIKINIPSFIELLIFDSKIDVAIKKLICQKETFTINLKNIKSNIYEELFNYGHVKVNWNNISLLKGKISDNKLIDFIIENYKTLINKNKIKNILELDNDFIKDILSSLIKNKLYDEADLIIKNFSDKSIIKYPSLPKDNGDYLIKNNLLQFNAKSLKQIITLNNDDLLLEYLENWYKENNNIIEVMKALKYEFNKLKLLLSSSIITNYDKLEIINKIYLKNDKSVDVIKEIIYIAFTKNKKYQVKYANNFMKNIFSNIKDITKYLEYDGDNISFVLE